MPQDIKINPITQTGSTACVLSFLTPQQSALYSLLDKASRQQKRSLFSKKAFSLKEDLALPLPIDQLEEFLFLIKKEMRSSRLTISEHQLNQLQHPKRLPLSILQLSHQEQRELLSKGLSLSTLKLTNQELFELLNARVLNTFLYEACARSPQLASLAMNNIHLKNKLPESETYQSTLSSQIKNAFKTASHFNTTLSTTFPITRATVASTQPSDLLREPLIFLAFMADTFVHIFEQIIHQTIGFFGALKKGWAYKTIADKAAMVKLGSPHQPQIDRFAPTHGKVPQACLSTSNIKSNTPPSNKLSPAISYQEVENSCTIPVKIRSSSR